MAGQVLVDDKVIDKAGTRVAPEAAVRVRGHDHPYVSRGGVKLAGALATFTGLDVSGRVAADVGASTGGFTDCLLQHGAAKVYAIDVGYGQLAWKIAQDPRVEVFDRSNIRGFDAGQLSAPASLVVIDCSFVALAKVLPHIPPIATADANVVALVKPQFELGPERVGKGGIVRDPQAHDDALDAVAVAARESGFEERGRCRSPITGREGNVEFFVWLGAGAAGRLDP